MEPIDTRVVTSVVEDERIQKAVTHRDEPGHSRAELQTSLQQSAGKLRREDGDGGDGGDGGGDDGGDGGGDGDGDGDGDGAEDEQGLSDGGNVSDPEETAALEERLERRVAALRRRKALTLTLTHFPPYATRPISPIYIAWCIFSARQKSLTPWFAHMSATCPPPECVYMTRCVIYSLCPLSVVLLSLAHCAHMPPILPPPPYPFPHQQGLGADETLKVTFRLLDCLIGQYKLKRSEQVLPPLHPPPNPLHPPP